ncbi:MAG: hypothetical protein IPK78_11565 [Rhodospirillales bacterium]|nr:hypothetical protein [Rhodospirillales bacterium]
MNGGKPDLLAMRRLLHCHQWTDVVDWGCAFGELANLSDAQIDAIAAPVDDGADEETAHRDKARR